MTTSQFIEISKTGKKPQFKELVGLKPLSRTAELMDFCTIAHPNTSKEAQGNTCTVFLKDNQYCYSMYEGAILKTNVETGSRTMYKHSIR